MTVTLTSSHRSLKIAENGIHTCQIDRLYGDMNDLQHLHVSLNAVYTCTLRTASTVYITNVLNQTQTLVYC